MKPVELPTAAHLPVSLRAALDPHGVYVFTYVNGLETPICEVYWAKSVTVRDERQATKKLLYGGLKPGALVGVIRYLDESSEDYREDFHDQKLKSGYYTMRYAVIAGDSSDFLVLGPADSDPGPEHVLEAGELDRLGQAASGTEEAAVLRMVASDKSDKSSPDVISADDGSCVLQNKLQLKSVKSGSSEGLTIAFIVATPIEEEGGS